MGAAQGTERLPSPVAFKHPNIVASWSRRAGQVVLYPQQLLVSLSAMGSPTGTAFSSTWKRRMAECADVLAASFVDEPLYTFMCPSTPRRRDRRSFQAMLWALGTSYDMVDVCEEADGSVSSVALWEPGTPTVAGALRSSLGILPHFWWSKGRIIAWARLQLALEARRTELAPDAHHLLWISTRPDLHGKGRGSALMRRGLARAAAAGLRCYLESTSPENKRLYERYGFEVVEEFTVARGEGPTLFLMIRPAQQPQLLVSHGGPQAAQERGEQRQPCQFCDGMGFLPAQGHLDFGSNRCGGCGGSGKG